MACLPTYKDKRYDNIDELLNVIKAEMPDTFETSVKVFLTPRQTPKPSIIDFPIIETDDIINFEGKKGAAQYDRDNKIIKVNRVLLQEKFKEKAWTKPRELMETLNGEQVKSFAQALPPDQFKTYNEWEQFVINHEYEHSLYSREDFDREYPNKTKGDYESEINRRAISNPRTFGITEPAQSTQFTKKSIFTVNPKQSVDKKAKAKASIATQFIGFAEGIEGSSTALYANQAGQYANTGNYSSSDVIFVSIGGKRGDKTVRKQQQDKTIIEAIKALEAGATLITDNAAYVESSDYNEGEKRLAANLKTKGYYYSETTVDSSLLGVWKKQQPTQKPQIDIEPAGKKMASGVYVNQNGLSKDEQMELFYMLKPYLEEQAAKTNKGKSASKMIGLGYRWDYKINNPNRTPIQIPKNLAGGNTAYGYYKESINGKPLAQINQRMKDLIQKASGIDMTHYEAAIVNLYTKESFISSHSDLEESADSINYPVIGVNIGADGNFVIVSEADQSKFVEMNLNSGAVYSFGFKGVNRKSKHSTQQKLVEGFLPELTTKIDKKIYPAGSYRITITMRRVTPLTEGVPNSPEIISTTKTLGTLIPSTSVKEGVVELFEKTLITSSFTKVRQKEIVSNFALKHKMSEEQAIEYINQAVAQKGQQAIDKLKECY